MWFADGAGRRGPGSGEGSEPGSGEGRVGALVDHEHLRQASDLEDLEQAVGIAHQLERAVMGRRIDPAGEARNDALPHDQQPRFRRPGRGDRARPRNSPEPIRHVTERLFDRGEGQERLTTQQPWRVRQLRGHHPTVPACVCSNPEVKIGIIAPPWAPIPPDLYGGIEQAVRHAAPSIERCQST